MYRIFAKKKHQKTKTTHQPNAEVLLIHAILKIACNGRGGT